MSADVVWFVGSLVGGFVVREIGVEYVTRKKRFSLPEPIGEQQLQLLKQRTDVCRSYVPTAEFMRVQAAKSLKTLPPRDTRRRPVASLRNA